MNAVVQALSPDLISESDFAQLAALLKQLTGIHLSENKRAMLSGRISKRLKKLDLTSVRDYCALVQSENDGGERDEFITALTTNMTRFNREAHQFEHLASDILPDLVRKGQAGKRVRIWSTASSSGEEPYDLAFHLLRAWPDAGRANVRILATDIDSRMISVAREGIYPEAALAELPDTYPKGFLERHGETGKMMRVMDKARDLIAFRRLNLNEQWPFRGNFDVIMCRNVVIYFDDFTRDRLLYRFAARLEIGGTLYLGHSEAMPRRLLGAFSREGVGIFRLHSKPPADPNTSATPLHHTLGEHS